MFLAHMFYLMHKYFFCFNLYENLHVLVLRFLDTFVFVISKLTYVLIKFRTSYQRKLLQTRRN